MAKLTEQIKAWRKIAEKGCEHMLPPPISIPQSPPQCELTHKACSAFNCPKLKTEK